MPFRQLRVLLTVAVAPVLLVGVAVAPAWPQSATPPAQHGSALPKTPAEREKTLSDLYALLATADDEEAAKAISDAIERVWMHSGSPTIDLLMDRSVKAMQEKTADFGASDEPQSSDQLKKLNAIQFPAVIGGVVIVVNVKGIE